VPGAVGQGACRGCPGENVAGPFWDLRVGGKWGDGCARLGWKGWTLRLEDAA